MKNLNILNSEEMIKKIDELGVEETFKEFKELQTPKNIKKIDTKNMDSNLKVPKSERGKKLYFVLDSKAYEQLKIECKNKSLTMTKFLEQIILEKSGENQESISKVFSLTKINKELYDGTNATYSNINQIAHSINMFKMLNDGKIDDLLQADFLKKILDNFSSLNNDIQNLRVLILEFLLILESNGIENKKIKNKLKKYQSKLIKNNFLEAQTKSNINTFNQSSQSKTSLASNNLNLKTQTPKSYQKEKINSLGDENV